MSKNKFVQLKIKIQDAQKLILKRYSEKRDVISGTLLEEIHEPMKNVEYYNTNGDTISIKVPLNYIHF